MAGAALPLPMRIPMRLVERVSALGSGAAFAALVGYLDSLGYAFSHNSSGPWAIGALFVLSIASAFLLRWHPKTRSLRRARLVVPWFAFSLAGYLSALEESQQKPWSRQEWTTTPHHFTTGEWLASAIDGFADARFLLAAFVMFVLMALPLQLARTRAERGVAGQERGEAIVASVSLATALPVLAPRLLAAMVGVGAYQNRFATTLMVLAAIAALVNVAALVLAVVRSLGRARFLRRVTDGHEPSFRIDDTAHGRALVRVTKQGEGYRVADFTETLLELSELGELRAPDDAAGRTRSSSY